MSLPRQCPKCGSAQGEHAFVDYDPNPNDAQEETEWGGDLPFLKAVVCMDCGFVLGVFDPSEVGNEEESAASEFRVDEELT